MAGHFGMTEKMFRAAGADRPQVSATYRRGRAVANVRSVLNEKDLSGDIFGYEAIFKIGGRSPPIIKILF